MYSYVVVVFSWLLEQNVSIAWYTAIPFLRSGIFLCIQMLIIRVTRASSDPVLDTLPSAAHRAPTPLLHT